MPFSTRRRLAALISSTPPNATGRIIISERLIGDYLSRRDRSGWLVATKFGHHFNRFMNRTDDFSVDGVRAQLEASLRALRVETIDLYQFHSGSDDLFQNEQLWAMLAEQKHAGKIRHLGVSILQKGSEFKRARRRNLGRRRCKFFTIAWTAGQNSFFSRTRAETIWASLAGCRWPAAC